MLFMLYDSNGFVTFQADRLFTHDVELKESHEGDGRTI